MYLSSRRRTSWCTDLQKMLGTRSASSLQLDALTRAAGAEGDDGDAAALAAVDVDAVVVVVATPPPFFFRRCGIDVDSEKWW